MCQETEIICRILFPYIDRLVESLLTANIDLEEATLESLSELIALKVEVTVRQMVKELNTKMQSGELEALREIIRENPEAAKKAANYVAKKLNRRIRRLIEEELQL